VAVAVADWPESKTDGEITGVLRLRTGLTVNSVVDDNTVTGVEALSVTTAQ
jgi:hypothetical protein